MKDIFENLVLRIFNRRGFTLRYYLPVIIYMIGLCIIQSSQTGTFTPKILAVNLAGGVFLITIIPYLPHFFSYLILKRKYRGVQEDIWREVKRMTTIREEEEVPNYEETPKAWIIDEKVYITRRFNEGDPKPKKIHARHPDMLDMALSLIALPEVAELRGIKVTPEKQEELREVMGWIKEIPASGKQPYYLFQLTDSSIITGRIDYILNPALSGIKLEVESKKYLKHYLKTKGAKPMDLVIATDACNTGTFDVDAVVEIEFEATGKEDQPKKLEADIMPPETVFLTYANPDVARVWYRENFPYFEFNMAPEYPDSSRLEEWVESPSGFNRNAWGDPFCGYPNIVTIANPDDADVAGNVISHFLTVTEGKRNNPPCLWIRPEFWYVIQKSKKLEVTKNVKFERGEIGRNVRWLIQEDRNKVIGELQFPHLLTFAIFSTPADKPVEGIKKAMKLLGHWKRIITDPCQEYWVTICSTYAMSTLLGAFGINPYYSLTGGIMAAIFMTTQRLLKEHD